MSNLIINTWYGIIVRREEAFGLDWSDPPSVVLSYAQGFLSEKLQQPAEQRPSNIHTVTAAFCGSTGAAWTSDHRQRGCGCVEANGNGQQPTLLRPRTSAVRPASAPRMKVADRYPATRARPGRKEAVRAAGSRGKISAAASVGLSYATACWAGARSQTGHNRCVLPMRFAMRAFRGRAGILGLCFRTMTTSLGCGSVEPKEGPVTLRIVQVTDV